MLCEKFDVKEQTGAKKALECGLKTGMRSGIVSTSSSRHVYRKVLTSRKRIQGQADYVNRLLAFSG